MDWSGARPATQWGREHREKRGRTSAATATASGPANRHPQQQPRPVGGTLGAIGAPSHSGRPQLQLRRSAAAFTTRQDARPQDHRPSDPRQPRPTEERGFHREESQAATTGRRTSSGGGGTSLGYGTTSATANRGGHQRSAAGGGATFLDQARDRQRHHATLGTVPKLRHPPPPPPPVAVPAAPRKSMDSMTAKIPRKSSGASSSFDPRLADQRQRAAEINLMSDNERTESESEEEAPRSRKRSKTSLDTLASTASSSGGSSGGGSAGSSGGPPPARRRASSGSISTTTTRTPNTAAAHRGDRSRTEESELSSARAASMGPSRATAGSVQRPGPAKPQKSLAAKLTDIFDPDEASSSDGEILEDSSTEQPKQKSSEPEVLEILDDDNHDGPASDKAKDTGKRMMDAVKLSQAEVYSPGLLAGAWNAAKSVCSSVASSVLRSSSSPGTSSNSTLGLTKRNGLQRPAAIPQRSSVRVKRNEPAKIVPGGSIQNRSSEEQKNRLQNETPTTTDDAWWEEAPSNQRQPVAGSRLKLATIHTLRRETRSASRTASRSTDVCELHRGAQQPIILSPSRIAIGKKTSVGDCSLKFLKDSMCIECSVPKGRALRSKPEKEPESVHFLHKISLGDIQDLKIFLPSSLSTARGDEDPDLKPFLAVQAKKTDDNKLSDNVYSNAYNPESQRQETKFIVIEFGSEGEVDGLIAQMMSLDRWAKYAEVDCRISSWPEAASYGGSLGNDATLRSSRRSSKPKGRGAYPFLAGKESLLVYPFDGDAKKIEHAAKDLSCLGGSDEIILSDLTNSPNDLPVNSNLPAMKGSDGAVNDTQAARKISSGTVTLSVDDFLLLEPGEWLNDNVIDFVLRWISRHNDGKDAHFFSTHFYTKLADQGVKAVASWTTRKNRELNIFEKKMIFVPVNKALHWSLCVIVNPGRIKDFISSQKSKDISVEEELDVPCLLFFDSLKSHNRDQVRKNIHKWLNAEWERHMNDTSQPFTNDFMKMYCPRVPRQNNFCDCGVFVCRYAYALYQVGKHATLKVSDTYDDFKQVITNSKEFKFNMSEIKLLREQLMTLIEKLHEAHQAFIQEKPATPEDEESGAKEEDMISSLENQLAIVNHKLLIAKTPDLNTGISQLDDICSSSEEKRALKSESDAKIEDSCKTSVSNRSAVCLKESQESVVAMEIDEPEDKISHRRRMSDEKKHTSKLSWRSTGDAGR